MNIEDEFINRFIKEWIEDFKPRADEISKRGWKTVVGSNYIGPMEAEWITIALNEIGVEQVCGLSFEGDALIKSELINASRDEFLKFEFTNSYRAIYVTDTDESFLYYKDDANRFFLISGDEEFIKKAYKCSDDTMKLMFLDNWAYDDVNNQDERDFLINVWETYSAINNN